MANSFSNEIYRSPKALSYLAMGFLAGEVICAILYVVLSLGVILFPNSQMDLGDGTSAPLAFGLLSIVLSFELLLSIFSIVFFLIWEYRAFNNLSALNAQHLEYTPGWSVGWWFVPFANLIKPFQVMRELWNESDPDFDEELGFLSSQASAPTIIGVWWATFLIGNLFYRISDRIFDVNANSLSVFATIFGVAAFLHIISGSLAILIVKNITQRQEDRFNRIGQSQQFQPPPPPTDFSNLT
jgi:hypothetical protein